MPLQGEYAPGPSDWAREQVELYEKSGGTEGADLRGMPIIAVTSIGAKSGKLRKTPLMRVEHDGEYAAVASLGGAPKHPVWYYNLKANPHVELQDGPVKRDYIAREVTGDEKALWWERAVAAYPRLRRLPGEDRAPDSGLRAIPDRVRSLAALALHQRGPQHPTPTPAALAPGGWRWRPGARVSGIQLVQERGDVRLDRVW